MSIIPHTNGVEVLHVALTPVTFTTDFATTVTVPSDTVADNPEGSTFDLELVVTVPNEAVAFTPVTDIALFVTRETSPRLAFKTKVSTIIVLELPDSEEVPKYPVAFTPVGYTSTKIAESAVPRYAVAFNPVSSTLA